MKSRNFIMRSVGFLFPLLVMTGCMTNNYEEFYIAASGFENVECKSSEPIVLKTVITKDDVLDLLEDGYELIGQSSFTSRYAPFSLAQDVAEKHGANLVLLDVRFKEERQYTAVTYMPSYSTTQTHGVVSGPALRRGGYMNTLGSYSATSTTTTMSAVPVQRMESIYDHDAKFFRKASTTGGYGVLFYYPNRLPGESADECVTVFVKAVLKGSQAEKDGIKRHQIVKRINGLEIKTRKDIEPFANKGIPIETMEVAE